MQQSKAQAIPHIHPCFPNCAILRVIVTGCFLMSAAGCAHRTAEHAPAPSKPPAIEKHLSPDATQAPHVEQPDKPRGVERKSKEKKSTAATDKIPDKRLEQPEESSSDTFVPPPPLKPPTFGGAGG